MLESVIATEGKLKPLERREQLFVAIAISHVGINRLEFYASQ